MSSIESDCHDGFQNEENDYGLESWNESENMICAFETLGSRSDDDEEILGCPHTAKNERVHFLPTFFSPQDRDMSIVEYLETWHKFKQ